MEPSSTRSTNSVLCLTQFILALTPGRCRLRTGMLECLVWMDSPTSWSWTAMVTGVHCQQRSTTHSCLATLVSPSWTWDWTLIWEETVFYSPAPGISRFSDSAVARRNICQLNSLSIIRLLSLNHQIAPIPCHIIGSRLNQDWSIWRFTATYQPASKDFWRSFNF